MRRVNEEVEEKSEADKKEHLKWLLGSTEISGMDSFDDVLDDLIASRGTSKACLGETEIDRLKESLLMIRDILLLLIYWHSVGDERQIQNKPADIENKIDAVI